MSPSARRAIHGLVHEALVARVRLLLGQCGFDELLATQERVSQGLASKAAPHHAAQPSQGPQALAQAVVDALELDGGYYGGSDLEFIISEGLTSAGLALADVVQGHEQDSRARWNAEVVPALDRIAAFVGSVFDGSWARQAERPSLRDCTRQREGVFAPL